MGPVKCSECGELMDDPCPPITALFGLRMMLETRLIDLSENSDEHKSIKIQISYVKKQLQDFEIRDEEMHYQVFKSNKETSGEHAYQAKRMEQKVLVLECHNNHRRTYIVNCEE